MDCIDAGQFPPRTLRDAANAIWQAAKTPDVLSVGPFGNQRIFEMSTVMKLISSGLHVQAAKREEKGLRKEKDSDD